jgi:hypothetical protein
MEENMRLPRSLRLLAFVCWTAMVASPAHAQYAPTESELTVTSTTAAPGEAITISGDGFCPGTPVTVTVEPVEGEEPARTLDSFATDAEGAFSRSVTLPEDLPVGDYMLRATGTDRDCISTRVLGVQIAVGGPEAAAVPREPSLAVWQLFGLLVVALAALLLLVARRRRRKAQPPEPAGEPQEPPQ